MLIPVRCHYKSYCMCEFCTQGAHGLRFDRKTYKKWVEQSATQSRDAPKY